MKNNKHLRGTILLIGVVLMMLSGCNRFNLLGPKPIAPSIKSFNVTPQILSSNGGSVSIDWTAVNALKYTINSIPAINGLPRELDVQSKIQSLQISIPSNATHKDKTYHITFTAIGDPGTKNAEQTIAVKVLALSNPIINLFSINPSAMSSVGGNVTLSWSAGNVTSYTLSSSPALSGLPSSISDTTITGKTLTIPANTGSSTVTYIFTLTANGVSGTTANTKTVSLAESAPGQAISPSISSFSTSPGSMSSSGGTETLSWSAKNVTGYTLNSSPALSGLPSTISDTTVKSKTLTIPANTGSSTVTYTFSLTANGASGTTAATKTVSVPVSAPGQPTSPSIASFTASSSILSSSGGSETLSWSASNVLSYKLSSSPAISGLPSSISDTTITSKTLTLPANKGSSATSYTFTLTAYGATGTTVATKQVNVSVSAPGQSVSGKSTQPTISSFSASPSSMSSGGGTETLSWSTSNVASYKLTSSSSLSGLPLSITDTTIKSQTLTIPANTGSSTTTYTFTLTANGASGTTAATKTVSVTVSSPNAPTISSFTAGTSSFSSDGGSETLSWSTSNATSYKLSSSLTLSGLPTTITDATITSKTLTIPANTGSSTQTYTFTLTANGATGTTAATKTVSVTVSAPTAPTISSFTAGTSSFSVDGGSETLSWSTSNATSYKLSCSLSVSDLPLTISDANVTSETVTLPANTTASSQTYTFTLTANGATGTTAATKTVAVTVSGIQQTFSSSSYSFNAPYGIVADRSGNIWVTNSGGTSVTEIPSGSSSTTPVVLNSSHSPAYSFSAPKGIAVDASGNIYVANYTTGSGTGTVTEIPSGNPSNSQTTFAQSTYSFSGPTGIAADGTGNVFVTDFSTTTVSEIVSPNSSPSATTFNAAKYSFNGPTGIAVDKSGIVWVTNSGNSTVTEFNSSTQTIISASSYSFSTPKGIAIDRYGNIWVANSGGNSVTEIPGGSTTAPPVVFSSSSYKFNSPTGIAVDASGNVWVTNSGTSGTGANSVTEIPSGSPTTTPVNYSSSDSYTFNTPIGITIDSSGNVWVANSATTGTGANTVTELIGVAK